MPSARPTLVELRRVAKSYGSANVLRDINLTVEDGEFLVILGPSGSGKTTILRMIGGFTDASSGDILLDGVRINDVPINRRPFNTVFQDYALFPHMTVRGNVAYGLEVRALPRSEVARRTAGVLDLVSLGAFADRYPAQLSGGQRQRVALARAIVCEPRLVLLDEPLAALDVSLRQQMQAFLKDVQRQIRTTFLFITHDQEEAISLADRICVMDHGAVMQVGAPRGLYDRPGSAHVARFFGDNNLIDGHLVRLDGAAATLQTPLGPLPALHDRTTGLARGDRALMAIRPEKIRCLAPGQAAAAGDTVIAGRVVRQGFAGPLTVLDIQPDAAPALRLSVKLLSNAGTGGTAVNTPVLVCWQTADTWLVPA